ncbi:hypothetical protein PLICBS_008406 [Purpureocillium lilacinum]|uniref:uncharacterized protein n=1 Tax=Purpureocillium lilacinum TaxID=33203 RepID=UPI00208B9D79|nr:hypothetical protein PLICBS_008406 [Purpureocillium lilacinum]
MAPRGNEDRHTARSPDSTDQSARYSQGRGYSMGFTAGHVSEDDLIDPAMATDNNDLHSLDTTSLTTNHAASAGELGNGAGEMTEYLAGDDMFDDSAAFSTPKTVRFADTLETVIPASPDYCSSSTSAGPSPPGSDESFLRVEGCTAGSDNGGEWRMSNSMMVAYNAMRGGETVTDPGSADQAVTAVAASMDEANIVDNHMLSAAVDAEMPNNDGPRTQDVFTVPRPEYDHITPPADAASNKDNDPGLPEHIVRGIKRQAHLGGKHDIDELYDVSDGEDDVADGRISPCTFRLWADGAADESERATGPGDRVAVQNHDETDESDLNSGIAKAGSDPDARQRADAAEEAKAWPTPRYVGNSDCERWLQGVEPASGTKHYPGRADAEEERLRNAAHAYAMVPITEEEIRAALAHPDAPSSLDGIAAEDIFEELNERHQRLQVAGKALTDALASQWAYAQRINRRAPHVQLAAFAAATVEFRAQRGQDAARLRRRGVYRYVEARLRGVEARAEELEGQAAKLWAEVTDMMRVDRNLTQAVVDMARAVGITELNGDIDALCERVIQLGRE